VTRSYIQVNAKSSFPGRITNRSVMEITHRCVKARTSSNQLRWGAVSTASPRIKLSILFCLTYATLTEVLRRLTRSGDGLATALAHGGTKWPHTS